MGSTARVELGPEQTVYEKAYEGLYVRCYELSAHRVLVYSMRGYIVDADIDASIADLLAAVRDRHPVALIADPRELRILSAPFQIAIRQQWWPELARLGIARNPTVAPTARLTSLSIDRMIRGAGKVIETPYGVLKIAKLPTLEACLRWCLQADEA